MIDFSAVSREMILAALDHQVVGVHRAADHGFAQAPGGGDHQLVAAAVGRVGGEHHAGGLRLDHLLDDHGQGHRGRVDLLAGPIGQRALGPQRGPAVPDRSQQVLRPADVQVGLLLAGETRVRQVLRGGRGAYGDGLVLRAARQRGVRRDDLIAQVIGHGPGAEERRRCARRPLPGRPADVASSTMSAPIWLAVTNSRYAAVVITKPGGTGSPAADQFTQVGALAAGACPGRTGRGRRVRGSPAPHPALDLSIP